MSPLKKWIAATAPLWKSTYMKEWMTQKMNGSSLLLFLNKMTNYFKEQTFCFFFYLGFPSRTFTNHRTTGEEGGHLFNFSLPLPPAWQTLRHYPGDCCREPTSAHSWQPDSNQEPLVSERKSLTSKLRAFASGVLKKNWLFK